MTIIRRTARNGTQRDYDAGTGVEIKSTRLKRTTRVNFLSQGQVGDHDRDPSHESEMGALSIFDVRWPERPSRAPLDQGACQSHTNCNAELVIEESLIVTIRRLSNRRPGTAMRCHSAALRYLPRQEVPTPARITRESR
jgi:hypothetical protein